MQEYKAVETQLDVENFMKEILGFHDCVLEKLNYVSGNLVDQDGKIKLNIGSEELPILQVIFGSQNAKRVELLFIGVKKFYIAGKDDIYPRIILDATLNIQDDYIVWADEDNFKINKIDENITYIVAKKLKYKFI